MTNNDILRRIRFALDIKYTEMIEIFALATYKMKQAVLVNMLKQEEDPNFHECSDRVLELFLDGLITQKRGAKDLKPGQQPPRAERVDNNLVLRKIKIALSLRDTDMVEILKLANFAVAKSEVNALFQRKEHKNYKECGNQFLRNFLVGLTKKLRKVSPKDKPAK